MAPAVSVQGPTGASPLAMQRKATKAAKTRTDPAMTKTLTCRYADAWGVARRTGVGG